jgi:predicted ATPase
VAGGDAGSYTRREVDWTGDGVFLAFERAAGAVVAAAEIQVALAAEEWPAEAGVRLRIGVHTGEPKLTSEGYVGIDVHRAARICAAAHGGQVVLSQSTRALVGDEPFPGALLRPLGAQLLKDLPEREALFQLMAPGLAEEFPPLRTLGGATLPALYHRLVGRRAELARIEAVLAGSATRLLTITGPGGAGKSRLALEAAGAAATKRPVYLVGLALIADPALVPSAIARAVGARESPERALVEDVADRLAGSSALVVLDNLEHLAPAASTVARLLDLAPDLAVLATSRSPLRLAAEHVLQLAPLPVDDAATLLAELAVARGVTLRSEADPALREICRRLDGLPLAIELVAARLTVLSPPALLRALGEGLALAAEGPVDLPERQRTLRATIDWSYGLLSERQRELHAVLATFAGGAGIEDARIVANADAGFLGDVEALVAGNLLRSDTGVDGEPRLSMLETVREYALERLAATGRL